MLCKTCKSLPAKKAPYCDDCEMLKMFFDRLIEIDIQAAREWLIDQSRDLEIRPVYVIGD